MAKGRLEFKRIINRLSYTILANSKLIIKTIVLTLILFLAGLCILFFSSMEEYFSCLAIYFWGGEASPNGEFLKTILQTIGGVIVIFGALTALRRVIIMEENSISDKFKNAIEQIGSNKTSIVKGGLYSINEIARKNKEYRFQVFNILVSHIKDTMSDETDWNVFTNKERKVYQLPIEVQTALDILFRNGKKIYQNYLIDLSNVKLYKANLNYMDMRNAYMNKTQLQGAFLSFANLSKVDLEGANMSGAQLHETNLIEAKLSNSFFIGTELVSTKFQFAKLRESHFEGSFIHEVHFEHAFLHKAKFIGCNSIDSNFNTTDLSRADFSGSRLIRQHFIRTYLVETKFYGSLIQASNFKGANLLYTRFDGACSKLNSPREEMLFTFLNVINQRIEKETELDNSISLGKLLDEEKTEIIEKFKTVFKDKKLINKFVNSINNPIFQEARDIEKVVLSNDIAQAAITEFNKAIKFAGILLPK